MLRSARPQAHVETRRTYPLRRTLRIFEPHVARTTLRDFFNILPLE